MSFAQDAGYTPESFDTIISDFRLGINTQFSTAYTVESFVGTNWYKYAYALAQKVQSGEVKTSEVFQKLQEYISDTNEKIKRPSVSFPGLIEAFESEGYTVSVKPPSIADAGLIYIGVDLDNSAPTYPATRAVVCELIRQFVAAGIVSVGTQVENITLDNGQAFDFKFSLATHFTVQIRASITVSKNTQITVPTDSAVRDLIRTNIAARYRMGWNFEPQKYLTFADAPWAGAILMEYSIDGGVTWRSDIYFASYTDLFIADLANVQVVFL